MQGPFDGKKGQAFKTFVRDFGSSLASECDDDSDLEETMLGTDLGGDVYLAGGGVAANGPQTRRRNKRNKIVYSQLYRHITDIRLREMLHAQTRNDGRAAFLPVLEITRVHYFRKPTQHPPRKPKVGNKWEIPLPKICCKTCDLSAALPSV